MEAKLVTTPTAENPVVHDLELQNGQFVMVGGDINDAEDYSAMVAQRIVCRLLMVRGE